MPAHFTRVFPQNAVFIDDYQYFQCHGGYDDQVCYPCQPYFVTYDNCKDPSRYTLSIPFIMPNKTASVRAAADASLSSVVFHTC